MNRTPIPEGITRDDVLLAIQELKTGNTVHEFHDSERYDLVHDGERFAPKAVIGIAAKRLTGHVLVPADFIGGESSKCFRVLRSLGFTVELKPDTPESGPLSFEVGREYNRRSEIHGPFGGQMQGGIATPSDYLAIFLFTGERGSEFGYEDQFREDGVFLYTGEGQDGDMSFVRGNLAIRDSIQTGKQLLLFEQTRKGFVRFVGPAHYVGHHKEQRPDSTGAIREAIVFELGMGVLVPSEPARANEVTIDLPKAETLDELRAAISFKPSVNLTPKQRLTVVHYRSEAVKRYVLARARGRCEGCENEAPFKNKKNQPYLEPHHTTRRADGGPDAPAHVIALCPNCHRRVHSGIDGETFNQSFIRKLKEIETSH